MSRYKILLRVILLCLKLTFTLISNFFPYIVMLYLHVIKLYYYKNETNEILAQNSYFNYFITIFIYTYS